MVRRRRVMGEATGGCGAPMGPGSRAACEARRLSTGSRLAPKQLSARASAGSAAGGRQLTEG